MNARAAESLIEKTFSNEFDLENFKEFLIELFNRYDEEETSGDIPNQYNKYVKNIISLGSYTDDDSSSIVFYAIELKSSSIHRARTMQRNLIGNFLKNRRKKAALVAFFNSSTQDWRFSYVKRSLKMEDGGVNEQLSAPERHSFLVGPNEPNHTCKSQFKELLQNEEDIFISDIEKAFKIENVTEEFYKQYKKLYKSLKKSLEKNIADDPDIKAEFKNKNIKPEDFAKKLMGQLIFIYFLQKKGLLGVEKDCNWGTGPKNFLRKLFDKEYGEYDNFFDEIIEPLFYEGLSVDTSDYHYEEFEYKVPFLNSGLFDPINNYNWKDTRIRLDNDIFEKIIKTFDQYNFTVKEDEPLEKEVAIDPEMLGKVYENLLEEEERSENGTFYTPRYIVQYICQEVLINYLSVNSKLSKEDLKNFINNGDNLIERIIKNNEEIIEDEEDYLSQNNFIDSIKNNSEELYLLLSEVKIIDPAVGSGALLVSMMNEIVKARYLLLLLNGNDDIDFFDLKKETIENSLYGVDIKQPAIEITKLRFCLSLIVEEEGESFVRPLPNLDNKIKWGNSLVDSFEGVKLCDGNIITKSSQTRPPLSNINRVFYELESKKREYFKTSGFTGKNILKNEINELKWNFIESNLKYLEKEEFIPRIKNWEFYEDKAPFFIWELEFSEVFRSENPGFDIVICHPPFGNRYPFGSALTRPQEKYLKEKYSKCKSEKVMYFIQLAYDKLLKNNGELGYIIPKGFAHVFRYTSIRNYILDNIETVIDCGALGESRGEQIILTINKSLKLDSYYNGTIVNECLPETLEEQYKDDAIEFGMILNSVNKTEINIAKKIKKSNRFLEAIIKNQTGMDFQSKANPNEKFDFIGGKEIQREGIVAIQGKIGEEYIKDDRGNIKDKCTIKDNSILVQEILSISKGHLKITACIPNINDLYICSTINQIMIEKFTNFSNYFIWALLNSRLINWYCQKFIYANAIRTIHFNTPMINKIPLPSFNEENEKLIDDITEKSQELNEKYNQLLSLREVMFDCMRNNIEFAEEIRNFEDLDIKEFINALKSNQNITIKVDNSNKYQNFKMFFNNIKDLCLEINEDESIESEDVLYKKLQLLKDPMFDYLKDRVIHNIKTSTNGKLKNFENLEYEEFTYELSKKNIDFENITNLEEFFKNIKESCLEISEEISSFEENLDTKIYKLYNLNNNETKIIDKYFS